MMLFRYINTLILLCVSTVAYSQVTLSETQVSDRPQDSAIITFYALGDWGTGYIKQEPVAIALERNVARIPQNKKTIPFVIGLGDNIYESGLPYHKTSDQLIYAWNDPEVFNAFENTFGQVYQRVTYQNAPIVFHVVPGNHDHDGNSQKKDKKYGDILLQESKGENLYPDWWKYYPIDHSLTKATDTNDFGEYVHLRTYADEHGLYKLTLPQKLDLPNQNVMMAVALDTQMLLEMYEEDEDETLEQHWAQLEKILTTHKNVPWKMIVGHHPIASWGIHGGAQGGLKGAFRYGIGIMQDLKDGDYKKFRKRLATVMKKHNVHLYLSGHDHNIQLIDLGQHELELLNLDAGYFQLVSGSAGKLSSVDKDHKAVAIYDKQHGFVRLDANKETCWIEFLSYDPNTGDDRSLGIWTLTKGAKRETQ
ncbi:MAG: hypothetical protein HOE48_07710 [Candidatus Latescibacteria bacterium]|nr:hypothetical protein [Candidatus Latescibacterota bacterium]